jgi:DNA-binding transcriptional regulator YiaG
MTPGQLTAAIHALGLSAEGFARCAGVSGRTVRHWQNGDRPIPGLLVALIELLLACRPAARLFAKRDPKAIAGHSQPTVANFLSTS